jgi:predicted ATP-dependent endonuclease of OLD family
LHISKISVTNFRGLCDVSTSLSGFSCVIGENNVGKSSLLLALKLFIEGKKLTESELYDVTKKEATVQIELSPVDEKDVLRLASEHRDRIRELIIGGKITLIRHLSVENSGKLTCIRPIPNDEKFHDEFIGRVFTGKKGKAIVDTLKEQYPEIPQDRSNGINTHAAAKDVITQYVGQQQITFFKNSEGPLPTGIDNSIRNLLPEPVYITAVKDLSDEMKTKESTPFGKLLAILLNLISREFEDAQETFRDLNAKLNVIRQDGDVVQDDRIQHVRDIEATIQRHIQDIFSITELSLRIPPPEIKTVLSNAVLWADDGSMGPVELKGDGFKRAVTFSILRSYVELSRKPSWNPEVLDMQDRSFLEPRYLFMFEEPELFLHPKAQRVLFDALSEISKEHQVIVSTHSPMFFSHSATGTFVKMVKKPKDLVHPKPHGIAIDVEIGSVDWKDRFQIISFETSNTAFFAERIVLVEGDTDLLVYPHMARILKAEWGFGRGRAELVKIGGKSSIKRYKEFFSRFDTPIFIIGDLDILLDDLPKKYGIQLSSSTQSDLISHIDQLRGVQSGTDNDRAKLLQRVEEEWLAYSSDSSKMNSLHEALATYMDFKPSLKRIEILEVNSDATLVELKRRLIMELREQNLFVLEKGAIEKYYPTGLKPGSKVEKAQNYCEVVTTRSQVVDSCSWIENGKSELEIIFDQIFSVP